MSRLLPALPAMVRFALLFVLVATFSGFPVYAQTWELVGNAGFSAAGQSFTSIAIDPAGTPYVAYQDSGNSLKATVMMFTGGSWVAVGGAGVSADRAENTCMAVDHNGIPYVAFMDFANGQKLSVMEFDGAVWSYVGIAGLSAAQAFYPSIAISPDNTVYVAYEDGPGGKAIVKKYSGGSWVTVGSGGISASNAYYIDMAIDRNSVPYIVYRDVAYSNKATVMKYNGSAWVTVGSPGISDTSAYLPSIAIDKTGTPYIAYINSTYGSSDIAVKKYSGGTWSDAGTLWFNSGIWYIDMAVDSNNIPCFAHTNDYASLPFTCAAQYYDSTMGDWVFLGNPSFSEYLAYYVSIAIGSDNTKYVAYLDAAHHNGATVMKLTPPTGIASKQPTQTGIIKIAPNPCSGSFQLNVNTPLQEETQITITNVVGVPIKKLSSHTNTNKAVQLDMPGMYFVSAVTAGGTYTTKVIVN